MSSALTRDEGMRRKNFGKYNKFRRRKINNSEILKPIQALSVRAFISVFGFVRNLLRFCGFRVFFARFCGF